MKKNKSFTVYFERIDELIINIKSVDEDTAREDAEAILCEMSTREIAESINKGDWSWTTTDWEGKK